MHHMIMLLKLLNDKSRITLPQSFHNDLSWWYEYSKIFKSQADFLVPEYNVKEILTDACLQGIGGVSSDDFFQGNLLPSDSSDLRFYVVDHNPYDVLVPIEHYNTITILELISVLLSLLRWKELFRNARVLINVIIYKYVICLLKTGLPTLLPIHV